MPRIDQRPRRPGRLELLVRQSAHRRHGHVAGMPQGARVEHVLENAIALIDQLLRLAVEVDGGRGANGTHTAMLLVRGRGVAAPSSESAGRLSGPRIARSRSTADVPTLRAKELPEPVRSRHLEAPMGSYTW